MQRGFASSERSFSRIDVAAAFMAGYAALSMWLAYITTFYAPTGELLLIDMIVCRRYDHQRHFPVLLSECEAELTDVIAGFVLAVYHYPVGTGFYISVGPLEGVQHALSGNEAFYPGDNHEVFCYLRFV